MSEAKKSGNTGEYESAILQYKAAQNKVYDLFDIARGVGLAANLPESASPVNVSKCRHCQSSVVYLATKGGALLQTDYKPHLRFTKYTLFDHSTHTAHGNTCKYAHKHTDEDKRGSKNNAKQENPQCSPAKLF
ncbi:MAG: hypothetical protein ACRCVX_08715 [Shewanella sp.]